MGILSFSLLKSGSFSKGFFSCICLQNYLHLPIYRPCITEWLTQVHNHSLTPIILFTVFSYKIFLPQFLLNSKKSSRNLKYPLSNVLKLTWCDSRFGSCKSCSGWKSQVVNQTFFFQSFQFISFSQVHLLNLGNCFDCWSKNGSRVLAYDQDACWKWYFMISLIACCWTQFSWESGWVWIGKGFQAFSVCTRLIFASFLVLQSTFSPLAKILCMEENPYGLASSSEEIGTYPPMWVAKWIGSWKIKEFWKWDFGRIWCWRKHLFIKFFFGYSGKQTD